MYTLGIDIGSTTSKCVILQDGASIAAKSLQLGGLGTDGPEDALAQLWQESGLTHADMARVIVTGYGRNKFEGADGEVSELTCHALGGRFVFPDLRTVIDIGGQDAKIISLTPDGRMSNFIMNDKCAAGTGRFLEVMANILRLDIDDLGTIAAYDISPVMMNIYGLDQPLYFQFLNRQLQVADRANTRGTVMNLDGTTTQTPSSLQESWSEKHWLLQYDLMFGKGYALSRMGMESLNDTQTGK